MKNITYILILAVVGLLISDSAFAVSVPYRVSFTGCSADTYYDSNGGYGCGDSSAMYNNINGTVCSGGGTTYAQQIALAANNPLGAGGRGFRRFFCNTGATGSISFDISTTNELWMRFYIRMQPGFQWNGFSWMKTLNFTPISQNFWVDIQPNGIYVDAMGGGGEQATQNGNGYYCQSGTPCGWNQMNPRGTPSGGVNEGDGSWHSFEIHIKDQTGSGTYDGQLDFWLDGTLVAHTTTFNFNSGAPQGIRRIQFWANFNGTVNNANPAYIDIDDISVSTSGYIGPLGGSVPAMPSSPRNLR
jgi:hypothetical protein